MNPYTVMISATAHALSSTPPGEQCLSRIEVRERVVHLLPSRVRDASPGRVPVLIVSLTGLGDVLHPVLRVVQLGPLPEDCAATAVAGDVPDPTEKEVLDRHDSGALGFSLISVKS